MGGKTEINKYIIRNPFHVLELSPGVTSQEIERQGKKILGMLELEIKDGQRFSTPGGDQTRNDADVRQAMAALQDSRRYRFHTFWYLDSDEFSDLG